MKEATLLALLLLLFGGAWMAPPVAQDDHKSRSISGRSPSAEPLLVAGAGSVFNWYATQLTGRGDLRPYALVQFGSLTIVVMLRQRTDYAVATARARP